MGSFLSSQFYPIGLYICPIAVLPCLNYYIFVASFEIMKC